MMLKYPEKKMENAHGTDMRQSMLSRSIIVQVDIPRARASMSVQAVDELGAV